MKTSDFYYDLPEELIAQTPIEPRDHSRLMVLDKKTGSIGEPLTAGSLGEKTITADKDNASEIILGDPIMCDSTNIDSLSDIY